MVDPEENVLVLQHTHCRYGKKVSPQPRIRDTIDQK